MRLNLSLDSPQKVAITHRLLLACAGCISFRLPSCRAFSSARAASRIERVNASSAASALTKAVAVLQFQ
jgi:hypothetical protein